MAVCMSDAFNVVNLSCPVDNFRERGRVSAGCTYNSVRLHTRQQQKEWHVAGKGTVALILK